ncbi:MULTISPECIES: helix-turn-helix domain-containing protein [Streptomyces]|uniref:helix-turn-helix domain-containing protein n=1 Tax=Streptomyces TaxID=1883 RepID=UPI00081B5049|nr:MULTISPECIES: pyridoxamine 5'-phosphate oxidase family protein [unclassified Streptomyces]MYQ52433.1 helix-turn-helix domain-containing protein [Streptomyces sp. SID4941]SCD82385.1 Helix-turn-helix domain-containing protein [Streptomyces sp. PalvLS-984]SDC35783.1 Predicted flavin-nucleotide-binding protein [Streptomyces sp. AmelKG-A3]
MTDRSEQDPDRSGLDAVGDVGRRVAARREYLGLSREELALRTHSAPGYIEYVETRPGVHGMSFMLRLADALGTSVGELTGATVDLPPGVGRAAYHPDLVEIGEEECWKLLGSHGVGRVVTADDEGPAVLPVNYLTLDGEIAYRTSPDSGPARAAGHETAFEVDHIDDAFSRGWSVLVVGEARSVTDPASVERFEAAGGSSMAWAGGRRDRWIAVTPRRVTGRRIVVHDR